MLNQTEIEIFNRILYEQQIMPVYQPIVSLTDGKIFGYEALSRVLEENTSDKVLDLSIEHIFIIAEKMNKLWEFETLCRRKALENAKHILVDVEKKLFLNVNPNVINDVQFKDGFTKRHLVHEYGQDLNFNNIVFEITERSVIVDKKAFLDSIEHYRKQNYGIAIDDVGSGYSGLNVINDIKPDIIKLDMNLIRNIDKDETKQFLCKAMIGFGKNAEIKIIAEGIETEEELQMLIKLGVDFGQGYFLGIPRKSFEDIAPEKISMIEKYHSKKYVEKFKNSIYPSIGYLSRKGYCLSPNEKSEDVYEMLRLNPTITEFTIVEHEVAVGFMTRFTLNEIFSGRYGYSLYSKKKILELANNNFLKVNHNMSIDYVSRIAMQRPFERLYNPIVVEQEGKYLGIVTIKDLLDSITRIEIDMAIHSNPLTGLPGNILIEKEITNRIFGSNPYCITYYDLDNFKAYNDAYGFQNGDIMLALVADILKSRATKNEFVGHIGGDDFIVICDYNEGEEFCQAVINEFSSKIKSLYREEDVKNGYIMSKNRHGVPENFPLASLSIAGVSNRTKNYKRIEDFSIDITKVKKNCKKQKGNYFEIL
ncbi:MAG: GGDEF domain-containing protein [Fibromonadaceae bacterium]|jgi:diguanylate cyclase (GGDEF)-like protein|nr:GGDEF domain-containing protein [Fibromonadaceae bacterium]